VCVDKWTYDNAISFFGRPKNTITIPVAVNLGTMSDGDASKIAIKLGLSGGPYILSLGHVVPLRDRLNLTRSVPLIVQKYPNMKVIVVGMVKDNSFLKLAEELGVREHFVIVGPVPHEEIKNYLAFADIETHDLDGRGLGITSVEAMDAGVPIVAWAIDDNFPQFSFRSYGPSGFIDDGNPKTIADKIDQIISDENYRSTILDSQRRLVDEIYSCKSVTDQYLKLLET
jgi:glycosyltransferase involved in cell wall biosynthesis